MESFNTLQQVRTSVVSPLLELQVLKIAHNNKSILVKLILHL